MSDNEEHISGINYELLVDDSMRNVLRGLILLVLISIKGLSKQVRMN